MSLIPGTSPTSLKNSFLSIAVGSLIELASIRKDRASSPTSRFSKRNLSTRPPRFLTLSLLPEERRPEGSSNSLVDRTASGVAGLPSLLSFAALATRALPISSSSAAASLFAEIPNTGVFIPRSCRSVDGPRRLVISSPSFPSAIHAVPRRFDNHLECIQGSTTFP